MKPRTAQLRLQIVLGCFFLTFSLLTFFDGGRWGLSDRARYGLAGVQLLGSLGMLWMVLGSKERP